MNVFVVDKNNAAFDFIKVKPGDHVVIKPNLARESCEDRPDVWEYVITSPWLMLGAHGCSQAMSGP